MNQFLEIMNPCIAPDVEKEMDVISLRSIYMISLIALVFEVFAAATFIASQHGMLDRDAIISVISVNFSIILCTAAYFLSRNMLRNQNFPHSRFFLFKIVFYVAFMSSAILLDVRNYIAGNQMVTFYIVNLVMICFILFRPWLGAALILTSHTALLICLYVLDGAAHIEPVNLFVLGLVSVATSTVRFHSLVHIASHTLRLSEDNVALENASRHDGLTGLLNRLALEDNAHKMDGGTKNVYMIDINYFKEINDRYGHVTGDEILRESSEALKRMYPGGRHYRYGGDEFLVVSTRPAEENYGPDTYEFTREQSGLKVLLSIGNAQGGSADYRGFFELISCADKALYLVKKRTHSAEYGGHDRRKER